MSFMQAQMTRKLEWLEVDGPLGTEWVQVEDLGAEAARHLVNIVKMHEKSTGHEAGRRLLLKGFGHLADYFENREVWEADIVKGYGVRSSAPGDAIHRLHVAARGEGGLQPREARVARRGLKEKR